MSPGIASWRLSFRLRWVVLSIASALIAREATLEQILTALGIAVAIVLAYVFRDYVDRLVEIAVKLVGIALFVELLVAVMSFGGGFAFRWRSEVD